MRFMLRSADKIVGAFVLAALLFLVGALLFVGINQRWFRKDREFTSRFLSADGLSSGMALELQGFQIGRVKSLRLNDRNQVEVRVSVHQEYADRVRPGSVLELVVPPLGLGSSLRLYPGRMEGDPLPEGAMIPSTDLEEGRENLRQGRADHPEKRDEVAAFLETLPPLVQQVETAARTLDQLLARLDRTLMGQNEDPADGLLGNVEQTFRSLDQTSRQIGELVTHLERTAGELDGTLSGLSAFSERLENPEGLLLTLLDAEGSLPKILHDDAELYEKLRGSLDGLDRSLEELRQLLGELNRSGPEISVLVDEAIGALDEGEKVLEGLGNHPLLRGGISPEGASPALLEGFREEPELEVRP